MRLRPHEIRSRLTDAGVLPLSRLSRFTAFIVGLDILFAIAAGLTSRNWARFSSSLSAWVGFLTFLIGVLLFALALRWTRQKLMWRLRNRLIVTYTFIGVIPVVLVVLIAGIALYLFVGQFATYVATADLNAELSSLDAVNARLASEAAAALRTGHPLSHDLLQSVNAREEAFPTRKVTAWYKGGGLVLDTSLAKGAADTKGSNPISPAPKGWERDSLVLDNSRVWLRAVKSLQIGNDQLDVISSVPLTSELLARLQPPLGVISVTPLEDSNQTRQLRLNADGSSSKDQSSNVDLSPIPNATVSGGVLSAAANFVDREVIFPSTISVVDWNTGNKTRVLMSVRTRPSLLYGRLFTVIGEFAGFVLIALAAVAVVFGIIELIALWIGVRLTQTITGSISKLYDATLRINRGDLDHRIAVTSTDQLAALEESFNGMTESLQKLIGEQKEKQRLESELAIAQEVQEQLFPKQFSELSSLDVYGICRPARSVSGDYYDFVPLGQERLVIAVGDVSGKGISAALLMATIHSAVRVYTLARTPALTAAGVSSLPAHYGLTAGEDSDISTASLSGVLNQQLYQSTPVSKYATLFLGVYDGQSKHFHYTNAGHLPPLILRTDGSVTRLDTANTVIGLLGGMSYTQAEIELKPDDLFLAYSDGVSEPENEFGEFGEDRLLELVQKNRNLPLSRISDLVIAAVKDWIGNEEQPDDITIVLARVR